MNTIIVTPAFIAVIALTCSFVVKGTDFLARKFYPPLTVFKFFEILAVISTAIFVCKENTLFAFVFTTVLFLSNTVYWQIFNFFEEGRFQKFFNLEWCIRKLALIAVFTWVIPYLTRFLLKQQITVIDFYISIILSIFVLVYIGLELYRRYPEMSKNIANDFLTAIRAKIATK